MRDGMRSRGSVSLKSPWYVLACFFALLTFFAAAASQMSSTLHRACRVLARQSQYMYEVACKVITGMPLTRAHRRRQEQMQITDQSHLPGQATPGTGVRTCPTEPISTGLLGGRYFDGTISDSRKPS